jgi:hypothetical protein
MLREFLRHVPCILFDEVTEVFVVGESSLHQLHMFRHIMKANNIQEEINAFERCSHRRSNGVQVQVNVCHDVVEVSKTKGKYPFVFHLALANSFAKIDNYC